MLSTVAATGRIVTAPGGLERISLFDQFRIVAGNRRYLSLVLVSFAQKLGEGIGYTSFAYFVTYVVHQPLSAMGLVVLASMAGQVIAQPFWLKASRRWSGATLYTVGALGWCLNLLLWLAMKDQSPLWLIPLGLQAGAAAGGFLMVTLGMLSNTMAADSAKSGLNREGIYSGFWLAIEKLAFAAGVLVVGNVIGLFGFVESADGASAHQTPTAVLGIAVAYCGVNMAVYIASIFAMRLVKTQPEMAPAAA
jgi:GPH family glycoside/pentoside/hexuronide:cation symporter